MSTTRPSAKAEQDAALHPGHCVPRAVVVALRGADLAALQRGEQPRNDRPRPRSAARSRPVSPPDRVDALGELTQSGAERHAALTAPRRLRARARTRRDVCVANGTSGEAKHVLDPAHHRQRGLDGNRIGFDERRRASTAQARRCSARASAKSPPAHAVARARHEARRRVRHHRDDARRRRAAMIAQRHRVVAGQHGEVRRPVANDVGDLRRGCPTLPSPRRCSGCSASSSVVRASMLLAVRPGTL